MFCLRLEQDGDHGQALMRGLLTLEHVHRAGALVAVAGAAPRFGASLDAAQRRSVMPDDVMRLASAG
jgi:hypothetical protein